MSTILTNLYIHQIRFTLNKNVTNKKIIKKWKELKLDCETENNEYIVNNINSYYKLESNKSLVYLDRCEGGICDGQSNTKNKQIRFRYDMASVCGKPEQSLIKDNDIIFDEISNSDDNTSYWTYEELNDIIDAFMLYIKNDVFDTYDNYISDNNIVEAHIELIKK